MKVSRRCSHTVWLVNRNVICPNKTFSQEGRNHCRLWDKCSDCRELRLLEGRREDLGQNGNCWVHTVNYSVAALVQRTRSLTTFSWWIVNLILFSLYSSLCFSWNCWGREDNQVDWVINVISLGSLHKKESRLKCVVNLKVWVVEVVWN